MTINKTAAVRVGFTAIVVIAIVGVMQVSGQQAAQIAGDFRNAAVAEVQDAQGQVLLRGNFAPVDADDKGEVERLATLTAVTPGVTGSGEAEVEYQTDDPSVQEVELTLTGMPAGADVTFVIDGTRIAVAKANAKGRVDVEVEVRAGVQ